MNEIIDKIISYDGRPSWDEYFMISAIWASKRSKCERLKVGCICVKDNRVISIGYNGQPSGWDNVCEDENNVLCKLYE
jgi:dCMP deaminase